MGDYKQLFIGQCNKAMKEPKIALESAKQFLLEIQNKEELSFEELKSLFLKQIVLTSDYESLAKKYNKSLEIEGVEELSAELKALCIEIKSVVSKISKILLAHNLSAEDFKAFLAKKSKEIN